MLEAGSRVLAGDVTSPVNVPNFARAMMDGFALVADDTQGATAYNAMRLRLLGTCLPREVFPGKVGRGQAVQIMTGAPLRKHVGQRGEDVRAGDIVVHRGRLLRPQDIGMISSIGYGQAKVICRPRVRILLTGNELLPVGTPPRGVQIADANGPMLSALAKRDGGAPIEPCIVPDDPQAILAALREDADIVLVSGGSSVGSEDHVPTLLAAHGELAIHGIAMRPSSPTGLGTLNGRLVFLLPGNPVSCLCAYDFFAGRAIRAMAGRSRDWPYRLMRARLTRKLNSVVGRVDYARVRIDGSSAEPLAIGGAAVLSSVTRADGFVIVPTGSEGFPEGADVEVFLYD
jgi:molybdopterin molybdotransferase